MLKKVLRGLFTLAGGTLGYILSDWVITHKFLDTLGVTTAASLQGVLFIIFSVILSGIIFYFISPFLSTIIINAMDYLEKRVQKIPISDVVFAVLGSVVGLVISVLISSLIRIESVIITIITIIITVIIMVLFADISIRKKEEILSMISSMKKIPSAKDGKGKNNAKDYPKVLDTSVIIDGRIFDLCQTGFIEGTLIIPSFVLDELRHIADSGDGLKRNRGRRGLDVLNKIQKELNVKVEFWEGDFKDINEVDSKLLKLAQVLNGKVITNDYNLNKVAEFQGVPVLNINELANAIKPVVLPGEEMEIQVVKDGKEAGQGVAYLDDGTMIVVEEGRRFIGATIMVVVTSVLQTAAGRMIFAKPKEA
jgi:uncharacterized protein YacL